MNWTRFGAEGVIVRPGLWAWYQLLRLVWFILTRRSPL